MLPTLIITLLAVFAVAFRLAFAVANEALNQVDGVRPNPSQPRRVMRAVTDPRTSVEG